MRRSCLRSFVVSLALLLIAGSSAALAQGGPEPRGPQFLLASASQTKAPVVVDAGSVASLRRRVSLSLDGARVGEALAELSRASGVQIVYADGVVPSEGRVHLRAEEITVAAALTEVLLDAGVDVLISPGGSVVLVKRGAVQTGIVAGRVTDAKNRQAIVGASVVLEGTRWRATTGDDGRYRLGDVRAGTYTLTASRIGYTKQSQSVAVAAGQEVTVDVALPVAPTELEQVVVTGTVTPTERKAIPTPISVITADQIEQRGYERVDQIFRGDIPGAIAWDKGAFNNASIVIVRGASSASLYSNYLKTYVDGVEVADPVYVATIDPSSIDRIEVLRGPQGSTIYGSQAVGGVMQIFTKKGELNTPQPQVEAKVSAGLIQSRWSNAAEQDHSVAVTGGGTDFSYRFGGGYQHNGNWLSPYQDAHSTNPSLYGGLRGTHGSLVVELSARYNDKSLGWPLNPDLRQYTYYSKPSNETDIVRLQTYGLTIKYAATPRWQQNLTIGYDRSAYESYLSGPRYTTPADSFITVYSNDETKASVAYNTTFDVALGRAVQASMTAGTDHWTYHLDGFYTNQVTSTNLSFNPGYVSRSQSRNAGYFAQGQIAFSDVLYVTAGLRAEDNQSFGKDFGLAGAPRIGASFVHHFGNVTSKARVSYGKAIRPPDPSAAQTVITAYYTQVGNPNLGPERQVGSDGGLELYFGQRGSLEANYYHQTAIDLIDHVTLSGSSQYTYQYQNVGKIRNTGWEFQARLSAGRLSFTGAYSIMHSVVEALSPTYSGDLRLGDPMLDIPKHTAGTTLSYNLSRTAVTLGMTYVGAWTDYDIFALYGYYFGGQPFRGSLRAYWMTYPSFVKFNLSVSQTLADRYTVFLRSDNLTDNRVSEINSAYMNMGRVTMLGVRTRF
jgi:outer membrane receptor protein involved in Fe transport